MLDRHHHLPAVDGMRAIAVLAVVAYHAGLPVPAGYVGVDIFFVISGYLITRLLHDEIQREGRINFLDFYARRARRIVPALATVILATLGAGAALLPPADLARTANAAASAFLFAANVFFANAPTGYFDAAPQTNPLLHLWSLGVEEQFYMAWPVVLVLASRRPIAVLAGIAVVSLALCEWMLWGGHGQAAFYQAPARAWELAAGGLIALTRLRVPPWAARVALVATIAACAVPMERFPGVGALPAVAGAAVLLAALHAGHRCRPLETKPVVWIGLISYSLYLWHWPAMVLGRGLPIPAQVVLAFTLATLSYYVVERPFRRRWSFGARRSVAGAALVVLTGATSAFAVSPPEPRVEVIEFDSLYAKARVPLIYRLGCDGGFASAQANACTFGPDNASSRLVIVGDSVMLQWFPAIYKTFEPAGWQIVVLTKSGCPMVDATYVNDLLRRPYRECDAWRSSAIAKIAELHPDLVLVGSANNYPFSRSEWVDGTRRILEALGRNAAEVRFFRSTPLLVPGGSKPYADVARWQREAAAGLENVAEIDMNEVVCPNGVCARTSDSHPIFRDDRHIQWNYSASLAAPLAQRLPVPQLLSTKQ